MLMLNRAMEFRFSTLPVNNLQKYSISLNIHEIRFLHACGTDILIFGHKLQTAEKKIVGLRVINSCPATLFVTLSNARPNTLELLRLHGGLFTNIIDDRYTLNTMIRVLPGHLFVIYTR